MLVAKQTRWLGCRPRLGARARQEPPRVARSPPLDRLARMGSRYLDDLEGLSTVLSEGESLAEDVEAARGAPQQSKGYVEARAAVRSCPSRASRRWWKATQQARSACEPTSATSSGIERPTLALPRKKRCTPFRLPSCELDDMGSDGGRPALPGSSAKPTTVEAFTGALRELHQDEPVVFGERMEEFAYLANVLVAGTSGMAPAAPQRGGRRGDRHGVFSARWSSRRIHRGEAEGTTDLRRVRRITAPAWRGPALSRGQQRPGGRRCAKVKTARDGLLYSSENSKQRFVERVSPAREVGGFASAEADA